MPQANVQAGTTTVRRAALRSYWWLSADVIGIRAFSPAGEGTGCRDGECKHQRTGLAVFTCVGKRTFGIREVPPFHSQLQMVTVTLGAFALVICARPRSSACLRIAWASAPWPELRA